jgi:hypothetical protein
MGEQGGSRRKKLGFFEIRRVESRECPVGASLLQTN